MPSHTITRIERGFPLFWGANRILNGYNFALEVPKGIQASLILYRKKAKKPSQVIPFTEECRSGEICSLFLPDFEAKDYEYNYLVDGKIVQDPCAYVLKGKGHFGQVPSEEDAHRPRCGFLSEELYDWEGDVPPALAYEDMILYKVHVRGYTKQAGITPKKRGSFDGLTEMIPYWKELGVNAVELMPAYEFQEIAPEEKSTGMVTEKRQEGKVNFWGYVPGFYFAPKSAYSSRHDPENEFRDFIKELHKAGIACIAEMYFPGEIDGVVALRAVQFWKLHYHVDGFHLSGEGVPVKLILRDKMLSDTKLMVQGVDIGQIMQGTGHKERNIADYSGSFQQDMRRFLKSDEDVVQGVMYHLKRNPSGYGAVNYITSQDGFTLADLVSYNYKHNEANGEDNQDGANYNYSWNCGIEGPCRKAAVRQLREKQMRNALLLVLLSQGSPMIYGGDEFGNSQDGNNNAYCQDNPVGWIDWKGIKKNASLLQFAKEAVAFRKAHPILHMPEEFKGIDYKTKGCPDISFHGERAWFLNCDNTCRLLGVMYCGAYAEKADGSPDDYIYVGYNFHWESRTIALPNLPGGIKWKKAADTSDMSGCGFYTEMTEEYEKGIEISPRTVIVLVGRQEAEDAPVASL